MKTLFVGRRWLAAAVILLLLVAMSLWFSARFFDRDKPSASAAPSSFVPENPASPAATIQPMGTSVAAGNTKPAEQPVDRRLKNGKPELDVLPVEEQFLWHGQLDQKAVLSIMESDRFDRLSEALDAQARSSSLASDLTRLYADALNEQWQAADPNVHLGRIACGTTLCIGSAVTTDASAWDSWLKRFDTDPHTPSYTLIEQPIDRDGGAVEHRFIFSTDPDTNGIVARPQ